MDRSGTQRLFVDTVTVEVRGGKGGDGCVAFHREKFVPKGGPSGGDGGRGGSVYLVADRGLNTLLELAGKHHWHAENGRPGEGSNCHGKNGRDLHVKVPAGTLVYDDETGTLLKDLVTDGEVVRVARGGRGGYGNLHYVSSTNQTPRQFQPGRAGQQRMLRLELKLIADIGLVGLPNAGKSTLLARVTNARPKIAAYPFTTKEPQLGILELSEFRRLVIADIPGLIEGAHEGVGLGDAFLRHIERTRVIVHMIDLCPPEGSPTPVEAYHVIRNELEKYSPKLAARHEIIVGSKLDLTDAPESLETLRAALGRPIIAISGVTGQNLRTLGEAMWLAVEEARKAEPPPTVERIDFGDEESAEELDEGGVIELDENADQ
ncbi:MAG: GTPase ObgE [Phycisphaerales bacterium]|nr:GTPase ObgE [Phycisphaerales bacterium]